LAAPDAQVAQHHRGGEPVTVNEHLRLDVHLCGPLQRVERRH